MRLDEISVDLDLKLLKIGGKWTPDDEERKAAWEMYVELVTRVSITQLHKEEGLLREALSSLYTLFESTRQILRQHGPGVAKPQKGELSFGFISVAILNSELRPLLSKWHPLLDDYETERPEGVSAYQHEKDWPHAAELRLALESVRHSMSAYAEILAQAAGVPSLVVETPGDPSTA